jgi:hypothetical protein
MPELILNDEQAKVVDQANGTLLVRDTKGRVVGRIEPELTPEVIAELKRRAASPGPRYTGEQVQARLRALQEEWDRTGGFDVKRARELLAELNAADPGHERRHKS